MGKEIKVTKQSAQYAVTLLLVSLLVSSCLSSSSGSRAKSSANSTTTGSVAISQGRVLKDNPIILSGNASLSIDANLNGYLGTPVTITSNTFLQGGTGCFGLDYCFEVRETRESASALQTSDGKWAFNTSTSQFLQVNTFYHMNLLFNQFYTNLGLSLDSFKAPLAFDLTDVSAIPTTLRNGLDGKFNLNAQALYAFANCDVANNAYYDQSSESLCFGYSGASKKLRWAQDSTIIYHEAGHFFQRLQLNLRNTLPSGPKAQLGNNLYTEAGALGEGLSDFFSYYVNGRTHWGEWAAGKLNSSRPMSESDSIHATGISTEEDQRLSYPQYITYDPNYPTEPIEDIHMSGMIISHYLVALTQDLETKCLMSNKDAREFVMYILNETMAELGDFTTVGTNSGQAGKVNMNVANASLWFKTVNPITFRSFPQTIAKNLLNTIGNVSLSRCNGTAYSQDSIETLLDSYGLLLFRTYNQDRSLNLGSTVKTAVKASNRKKSLLISKSNLILDPTSGASSAFVIDNRSQIQAGVTTLQSSGIIGTLSTLTPSDLGFNNGNGKVSPGEVVAIALNLYNNSNSTMGGIEVLANNWDHADSTGKPCRFGSSPTATDLWPLETEGGSTDASCSAIGAATTDFAPVCFIQLNDSTSTQWVSQKEYMNKISANNNDCLDPTPGAENECFIRAVKGADKAYFSKIDPKKTWGQTMANPKTGKAYSLDWGNVVLFEISKNLPQGVLVDCRMRLRFTNCEDCYHDSTRNNNDFNDLQYNGPTPYKLIHLQIPISE